MEVFSAKKTKRKKRRWRRRLLLVVTPIVLLLSAGVGFLLANIRQIVVRTLRTNLPGLRVSVQHVSLKSLSRLRITGLRLSGARDPGGSLVTIPTVDVAFRLSLLKGVVLNSVDLSGLKAFLRPGVAAILSSLARTTRAAEGAPAGPRIGKISLTNSTIDVSMPDFRLLCSLYALADSSSGGALLNNTQVLLRLSNLFLSLPSLQLRDLDAGLSAFIASHPAGSRIDVLRGELHIPSILRSGFRGHFLLSGPSPETEWEAGVNPFQLADVLSRFKESFPEIRGVDIRGQTAARVQLRYRFRDPQELLATGIISLRDGQVLVVQPVGPPRADEGGQSPPPKLRQAAISFPAPLLAEGVSADLPVRLSMRDGKTTLGLASDENHLAGASIAASRIAYEEQQLATDLIASFEVQDDLLKSSNAFFRSHGGDVNAHLSGSLRGENLDLQGSLNAQDVDLDEVFRRFGFKGYSVWGRAAAKLRFAFTTGPEGLLRISGDLSATVPRATIRFQKPLTVSGLEIDAPFEYSVLSGVQAFGVNPGESHPFGGSISAERIDYGEKVAADGTSRPQWSASDFWAEVVSAGEPAGKSAPPGAVQDVDARLTSLEAAVSESRPSPTPGTVQLSIRSCRAYDGEVTGKITASFEKDALAYTGELDVSDLDLERLVKGVGVDLKKFYINGLAQGKLAASGKGGEWREIKGEFSAIPPGGIIRIENVESFLGSLPAGKAVLARLKESYTEEQWKSFVEGMKEFRYRVATAKLTYPPIEPRPRGAFGLDIEIHVLGTGAGQEFDIPITISLTLEKD